MPVIGRTLDPSEYRIVGPDGILMDTRIKCKCVFENQCKQIAWKDGWCYVCYFDHREGT